MEIIKYIFCAVLVLGPVINISVIGEVRKPITKETAIASIFFNGFFLWFLLNY